MKLGELTRQQIIEYASAEACEVAIRQLMRDLGATYVIEDILTGNLGFYAKKLQDTQSSETPRMASKGTPD